MPFPASEQSSHSSPCTLVILYALRQQSKFPAPFRTQDAFARSDMVRWLVYPTELNAVPDEIELMKVVDVDEGKDGIVSYYLFRFRTFAPHWAAKDGWLTGVAGGFRKADIPTTRALGSTFSQFDKWDSKTPEEHLEGVIGTLGKVKPPIDSGQN